MRKLKLQMQVTIDGYACGPNDEMDFLVWHWDDELKKYTLGLTKPVDLIVLGRKLAQGFIPAWKGMAENPQGSEDGEFAYIMNDMQKVVFTKTLDYHAWERTDLAKGNLVDEIGKLKSAAGGDIIAYGGVDFVANLVLHDLIDEYYFFVNPVAIGEGRNIFKKLEKKMDLKLVEAVPFSCGISVNH